MIGQYSLSDLEESKYVPDNDSEIEDDDESKPSYSGDDDIKQVMRNGSLPRLGCMSFKCKRIRLQRQELLKLNQKLLYVAWKVSIRNLR